MGGQVADCNFKLVAVLFHVRVSSHLHRETLASIVGIISLYVRSSLGMYHVLPAI